MEITVQQEADQPVFNRKRLHLEISFDASVPARGVVANSLAESQGVPVETVAIRRIQGRFGGGTAQAEAFVYESADALAKFEQKHLVERTNKTIAAPEAPAEEAAEEPSEAPAEEPAASEEAAEASEAESAPEEESDDSEKKE